MRDFSSPPGSISKKNREKKKKKNLPSHISIAPFIFIYLFEKGALQRKKGEQKKKKKKKKLTSPPACFTKKKKDKTCKGD